MKIIISIIKIILFLSVWLFGSSYLLANDFFILGGIVLFGVFFYGWNKVFKGTTAYIPKDYYKKQQELSLMVG